MCGDWQKLNPPQNAEGLAFREQRMANVANYFCGRAIEKLLYRAVSPG
jgi:hypothetical protein